MSVITRSYAEARTSETEIASIVPGEILLGDAVDLSFPEDLVWRPTATINVDDANAVRSAVKPFRQKSLIGWIDYLYFALAFACSALCIGRLLWCGS